MTRNLRLSSLEPELSPDSRALSMQLDEALSARSLLGNRALETLLHSSVSTGHNYTKLENPLLESYSEPVYSTTSNDFEPQYPDKPSSFWIKSKQFWKSLLPGWRKGLALNSLYIAIVLFVNILWMVVTTANFPSEQDIYTIYEGSCSHASTTNSLLHIFINILSTALLASSNYAVQCLTSPTRKEVERAHKAKKWLYIGIPNMKNLFWISWRRKPLVILLVLSAWPLHLLWNSVVFKTLQANEYGVLVVSKDFISSGKFDDNLSNLNTSVFSGFSGPPITFIQLFIDSWEFNNTITFLDFSKSLYTKTKNNSSMALLENTECMKVYFQPILSGHRNLLLVTNTNQLPAGQAPGNGSILSYLDSQEWESVFGTKEWVPGEFICSGIYGKCTLENALKYADNWTVTDYLSRNYVIDYCLSEVVDEQCRVQLILPLMVIVVGCNLVKLICVVSTIFTFEAEEAPMVVIGDALVSFLGERADSLLSNKPMAAIAIYKRWEFAARSDLVMVTIL